MHEAHWSYSFLSTQNTYLHFGLCTGVSLLVFHVHLSLSSPFPPVSLSFSLSLSLRLPSLLPTTPIQPSLSAVLDFSVAPLPSPSKSSPRPSLCFLLRRLLLSLSLSLSRFLSQDSAFLYSASLVGVSTLTRLHTGRPTDLLASC